MRTIASVMIDRQIDDVFELTNNHVPQWSHVVVEDEVLEDRDGGGVGTRFLTVTEDRGRRMEFEGLVTRYDPPHLNAVELRGASFDLEIVYLFEDVAGRTRVTQTSDIYPKGMLKPFFGLFGWMMKKSSCKAAESELESLKAFCERDPHVRY